MLRLPKTGFLMPLEETFPNEARSADEVPILLLVFTLVCGRHVVERWVVQHRFHGDHIGGDASEFVVLVDTKYVAKESIVICCGLTPCVSDVLHLACKGACVGFECFVVALS
jgi:hypothetical protein